MLQDLTNQKRGGLNQQNVNMLGKQETSQSPGKRQGGLSQLGHSRMNRSESGSSLMSSVAAHANQIDQVKIERLLNYFNMTQKSDNIMSIVMLTMRELKSLIVSSSVALFVFTDEYQKNI